jgi:hypothetical protein
MGRTLAGIALLVTLCGASSEEPHGAAFAPQDSAWTPTQTERTYSTSTTETNETQKTAVDEVDSKGKASSGDAAPPPKIVVVVSKNNPIGSLHIAELRRVFLRQMIEWPNKSMITVYERSGNSPIGRDFSQKVFDKNPEAMREYWTNLQLTQGLKPPKVLQSAKLVKEYLQRVNGGIGYLYEHEVDDTVKVIDVKGMGDAER